MLVVAWVFSVSVDVTAADPEIAVGCVAVQVGSPTPPVPVAATVQASATLPVKPPPGVMVMVEVAELPGVMLLVVEALNENASAGTVD